MHVAGYAIRLIHRSPHSRCPSSPVSLFAGKIQRLGVRQAGTGAERRGEPVLAEGRTQAGDEPLTASELGSPHGHAGGLAEL